MNENEVQALWQASSSGLPTAFTPAELEKVSPAGAVTAPDRANCVPCAPFQRTLLLRRSNAQNLRLFGVLLVVPGVALVRAAMEHARWSVPILLGLMGLGLFLAARQAKALLDTRRALFRLNETMNLGGVSLPAQLGLAVAITTLLVTAAAAYWTWGGARGRQLRAEQEHERSLAECSRDPAADPALAIAACERVLQVQPDHLEAAAALARLRARQACEEKVRVAKVMAEEGYAEEALGAFTSLGAGCSDTLVQAAAVKARPLVEAVLSSTRNDCLAAVADERWTSAAARCGVYARYACQQMARDELGPPEGKTFVAAGPLGANGWRPTDQAYLGLLVARERLEPGNSTPWQCPDLTPLRPTSGDSERGQVDAREFLKVAQAAQDGGRFAQSLEWYRKAVAADPQNADAWLGLGFVSQELGKKSDAIAAFKRYLELRPETPNRMEIGDAIYFLEGK